MLRRDAAGRADAVHARRGAGHRGRRPCALGRLAPALRGTSPTQAQARDRRRRGERPRRDPRSPSAPSRRHRAARRRPEQAPPRARAALAADHPAGRRGPLQPLRRHRRRPVLCDRAPRRGRQRDRAIEPAQPHGHACLREAGPERTLAPRAVRRRAGRDPQGARPERELMSAASRTPDDRALAIVNPAAGNGAGQRLAARIARTFRDAGLRVEIERTPAQGEGARLAREAAEAGYGMVIAVGGDGTANEIANGLVGSGTALALYPIGAGNDFARALGYPRRRRDVPRFIRTARRRTIDVGDANGRVFLNAAGVGIDGHVAERVVATVRIVGPGLGWFAGALAGIATYQPIPMRVLIDGELHSGRFLTVVAANATHFGGGMRVAPQAELDDGQLDVVLAGDLGKRESLLALAKLYRGTHVNGTTITTQRARVVEIELAQPAASELDGEVTRVQNLSIRVRPRALEVIARSPRPATCGRR